MKILFITNTFPPNICGVGDYTYFLCKQFVQNGHKCIVVCHKDECKRQSLNGITVYPVVDEWNDGSADIIQEVIAKEKPTILSLQYVPHGFDAKGLPFGLMNIMWKLNKTNIPIFTFVHEPFVMFNDFNPKHWFVGVAERWITGYVLKKSNAVATSIENYKNRLSWYKDDISVIPIASNIPYIKLDDKRKAKIRQNIGAEGKVVIALFGVRDNTKLVEAIGRLVANGYQIKLLVLGRSKWQGEQPNWVYRTGELLANEIAEYFNVIDIFALPEKVSKRRKRGGACLKSGSLAAAIQYHLPIVTAMGDHTDDILKDKLMFADFNNVDDIENKLKMLVDDTAMRAKLSNGYVGLADTLTWEHTFAEYKRIIGSLL